MPSLVQTALTRVASPSPQQDLFQQNIGLFLQMHAAHTLVTRSPYAIDFRVDFWHKPERRLAIAYLVKVLSGRFYPPEQVRPAVHAFAIYLNKARALGHFELLFALGHYPDDARFKADLATLVEHLRTSPLELPAVTGKDRPKCFYTTTSLIDGFVVFLKQAQSLSYKDFGDPVFNQRINYMHYFLTDDPQALFGIARYLAAWYLMVTSTNAYNHGGAAQSVGPMYGNSNTQEIADTLDAWFAGQTLEQAPLFMHDANSEAPKDRSHLMHVLELHSFARLTELPIINNAVLPKYQQITGLGDGDPTAIQWKISQQLNTLIAQNTIEQDLPVLWAANLENYVQRVACKTDIESIKSAKHAASYGQDLYCTRINQDLKSAAKDIALALLPQQQQKFLLHLAVDAELYYSQTRPRPELQLGTIPGPSATTPAELGKDYPLNQILVGPPGTGKTYQAIYKALAILGDKDFDDIADETMRRDKAMKCFRARRQEGRIEMVTFHPGYAYEDFVEGLMPDLTPQGHKAVVRYTIRKGIVRRMLETMQVTRARSEHNGVSSTAKVWKVSLRTNQGDITDQCVREGWIGVSYDVQEPIVGSTVEAFFVGRSSKGKRVFACLVEKMQPGDLVCVLRDHKTIQAVGVVNGPYTFAGPNEPLAHRRRVTWIDRHRHEIFNINEQKAMSAAAIYQLRAFTGEKILALIGGKNRATALPYVLIIDEINRGNLARIFGEFITLIEADKRFGERNATSVRLAYSGEDVCLPRELHIIGTMNSADRSLTAMDAALRRRFEFERIDPNVELIPLLEGIDLRGAVAELNRRIVDVFGEDFQIGHSFFLEETAKTAAGLARVWFKQIIPTIAEHAYGDGAKLHAVLGPFVSLEGSEQEHRYHLMTLEESRINNAMANGINAMAKGAKTMNESAVTQGFSV